MTHSEYRFFSEHGPSDFAIDCEHIDHFCSPPPENCASAVRVAPDGSGNHVAGVCTQSKKLKKSNLSKGGLAVVRKGSTVDYMGLRSKVNKVRLGMFHSKTLIKGEALYLPCAWVSVVG